jgi:biotin operon repressor
MSRAEHYADSDARQVRYSRRVVHRALVTGHVGRDNAISGAELATFVPVAETTVRDVIAELRDDPAGPPIDSCGDGYYVIETPDELKRYVERVQDEIATKKDRLQANVKAFNRGRL